MALLVLDQQEMKGGFECLGADCASDGGEKSRATGTVKGLD
jgi:hypothetical protein